jgi:acetyltransferase-like isoleucine patch superfamily enzyme
MYVSISFRRVNQLRAEKYREAKGKGYRLISHVSPRAVTMPDLQIGDNCWIGPNTVVEPWVTIGDDVFIGGSSHVSHHCVIKDHCFIAASVAIAGFVTVEPYCFIGLNATVRDGITLARSTVVGGGALLLKDTAEASVYMARSSTPIPIRSDDLAEDFRHPAPAHP